MKFIFVFVVALMSTPAHSFSCYRCCNEEEVKLIKPGETVYQKTFCEKCQAVLPADCKSGMVRKARCTGAPTCAKAKGENCNNEWGTRGEHECAGGLLCISKTTGRLVQHYDDGHCHAVVKRGQKCGEAAKGVCATGDICINKKTWGLADHFK